MPDEVIVLGGHIDSWDVGQGAMDDGGGVVSAWEALRLIKQLGLKPRRTIRVVAWVNEEMGGPRCRTRIAMRIARSLRKRSSRSSRTTARSRRRAFASRALTRCFRWCSS